MLQQSLRIAMFPLLVILTAVNPLTADPSEPMVRLEMEPTEEMDFHNYYDLTVTPIDSRRNMSLSLQIEFGRYRLSESSGGVERGRLAVSKRPDGLRGGIVRAFLTFDGEDTARSICTGT